MDQHAMLSKLRSPFWFRYFLFRSLPAAFFTGLHLTNVSESSSRVELRYSWFSKNPFRSIYFACLAMAAEMASGILALIHTRHIRPGVSMLVLSMEASFHKKAIGRIHFLCEDGAIIRDAVQQAISSQQGITCDTISKGYDEQGYCVATFKISWTFKQRTASIKNNATA